MGRIARAIQNITNRINMNLGGNYDNECEHAQDLGDDSKPLKNDDGYAGQYGKSGRWVVLGFFDYNNKISEPGEKRIYGRDQSGNVTSHIHLQNDGTIVIGNDGVTYTLKPDGTTIETNGSGTKTMAADGTINMNGYIINPDGSASSPVSLSAPSVVADGKELAGHDHDILSGSSAPGPTGDNN